MKKTTLFLSLALLVVILFSVFKPQSFGSVTQSNEYQSKTISSSNASATVPFVIATTTQAFGSVIVTTTHATVLRFYDVVASSTAPQTATSTGRLLATLKASIGENTYVFDVVTKDGLIAYIPTGYAGTATITYR